MEAISETSEQIKQLVNSQRDFFNTNVTKDVRFRIEQLKKLKRSLKKHQKLLESAIYDDFKKSEFDVFTNEISFAYHDIDEAIARVKDWSRRKRARTNLINFPARSYVIPEPLGVSLVIAAWNYPYLLSFTPAIAAIAAGNTVVLKPSEIPSKTSEAVATVIRDAFSPEYFAVVEGGVPETTDLLNQKFDKIFFTGSVPVGKIVYQAAAKHLTPVTLELGGKSPAFVTEKCQLKMTAKRLIWSKFLNAGQTCIAPDYALVHASKKDEFLRLAKIELEKAQYSIENENYVEIASDRHMQRQIDFLDQEKIVVGGNYDQENRRMEPTIMDNITFDHPVMQDEIFGPILPVITYTDLDEAIRQVKARPKPLSCYIFTSDRKTREKILKEVSFGGGAVNDAVMQITNSNMPFGGVGASGIGLYHGEYGFKSFSHYKSILDKPTWLETSIKYGPRTPLKFKLAKLLQGQR